MTNPSNESAYQQEDNQTAESKKEESWNYRSSFHPMRDLADRMAVRAYRPAPTAARRPAARGRAAPNVGGDGDG